MKRPKTSPMWRVVDGDIWRMKDIPGYPPAPHREGRITRAGIQFDRAPTHEGMLALADVLPTTED